VDASNWLSIIIPVLNEAANLDATLASACGEAGVEIIVVDGGSEDASIDIAKQFDAVVIQASAGRATQMNAGAAIARGDVLLFLHADTRLPPNYATLIHQTLARPNVVAGAFDLKIDGKEWGLRLVEWGAARRSRFCQLPYGDQALFIKAHQFRALNGYPALPFMEDFVFVRQLKKLGNIAIAPAAVLTSSRRWQRVGVLRTTIINQLVIVGYSLGVSPITLRRWYRYFQ